MTDSEETLEEGITIRDVTRADLPQIERIEQQAFPNPWPRTSFERYLDADSFLVAESEDGTVCGYVLADATIANNINIGHIKNIAVAVQYRGNGIGTRLLQHAIATLAITGVTIVMLEVRKTNHNARKLYERVGFSAVEVRSNYYQDGSDAIVMSMPVTDHTRPQRKT
ncbi:ribosomal protein S18-alanine N-acetyltransferase [Salinarchaeum sp. IM2453]|uniref:ribosomal protein S18-alanine N-acetyltransferase n=1 Tax=Salinarchaeum sp. IM2453 TaxID=2862870 RepID=UPI001C8352A8|nr:ribosomal protein S18-alanine N-acetyltransferase [Salinarchaeum sp. IM2453]QZA88721.1 ribosomal protein S18-alanine N-acetyltransferase [Salinarchaeum sp. IM2453]